MKIERYPLHLFNEETVKDVCNLLVPEGSQYLDVTALHDGIYAWYAVPDIIVGVTQKEDYKIIKPGESFSIEGKNFLKLIDVIAEVPEVGQVVVAFPVFKVI